MTEKPAPSIRKLICFFLFDISVFWLSSFGTILSNLEAIFSLLPLHCQWFSCSSGAKRKKKKGRGERKTWFGHRLLLRAQIGPGTGDKREIIIQPAEAWQLLSSPRVKEMKHYVKNQLAKHRHILTPPFRASLRVRRHLRTAGRLFLIDSFDGISLPACGWCWMYRMHIGQHGLQATWYHDKNLPVRTFLQGAKYVLAWHFVTYWMWNVHWVAPKSEFVVFSPRNRWMYIWYVLCDVGFVRVPIVLTWNVCWKEL